MTTLATVHRPGSRRSVRLHPRTLPVQKASNEIRAELDRLQQQHDLTDIEMLGVLLHHQQNLTKHLLREERHPDDPERKADEE